MASIVVRSVATDTNHTFDEVVTIGGVKAKIESTIGVPTGSCILVGRKVLSVGQILSAYPETQPSLTLLLDNALALNTIPEITSIDMYTKIDPPRPVEILILHFGNVIPITISSGQTVADLRRELDMQLPMTTFPRRLTTLQAAMSNDDNQLCEYLLDPFPEGSKQMIMVNEEQSPPSHQENAPSSCYNNCCPSM